MLPEGNIEFALTRVQSQYGRRLTANDWRLLETSHDLGQYLDGARRSMFGPWVFSLDRNRDAHAIERSLRGAWRHYVRAVATWHPRRWQPWLAWLEWLPSLALLAQLARAAPAPAWLSLDPVLGSLAKGTLAERLAALKGSVLAVFEPGLAGDSPLDELWLARWKQLRPRVDPRSGELLATASTIVEQHARGLCTDGADAVALRDSLRKRLARLFRAAAGSVVATLCHLALMALDFERLRGGLVVRSLWAPRG